MATITIRNVPQATYRALKSHAAQHGRSMEAEIRTILEDAVRPVGRVKLGTALAEFGRRFGGIDLDPSGSAGRKNKNAGRYARSLFL